MMSLDDLRRHLGNPTLTDEQLTELRDTLYALAHVFIEQYLRERRPRRFPPQQR